MKESSCTADTADLDGFPRVDLVGTPDVYGPRDLGAYALIRLCYRTDWVFCEGFEFDN